MTAMINDSSPEARDRMTSRERSAACGRRAAVLAAAGATVLAACSGGSNSAINSGEFRTPPAVHGTPVSGGTVTIAAKPGQKPLWILPVTPAADATTTTVPGFDYLMWRPLYWTVNGVEPTLVPSMSLAKPPVWSNGDKTATITMNNYKWSDGQRVTSRDVLFTLDLIKAAIKENAANWAFYTPGFLPDDIASASTPNASTLVIRLKSAVNPTWFEEDELGPLQPMPSRVWARATAAGPALDFTRPANAGKIYDFLAAASRALTTYASNPLWQTVDGPFRLTSFNEVTGAYSMTANAVYTGPRGGGRITRIQAVPFTSDAAELNAVIAGAIDVGYVPLEDAPRLPRVERDGYNVLGSPDFGFSDVIYNFLDTTGDFNKIIGQLYIRQGIAHLEDEKGYITAFMNGAGRQAFGPVPKYPASPFTPADATADPYPFSVPAARKLLSKHGWMVVPNGTDTCDNPGVGPGECGAGIPAGTKLEFSLIYSATPALIGEEVEDLASEAKAVGINITLSSSSSDYIIQNYNDAAAPSSHSKWAMEDFGSFTNSAYPTTFGVFNSGGPGDFGGYDDARANKLITESVTSKNLAAVKAEASYLTQQQPSLFQPDPDAIVVWRKDISGHPSSFANLTQYYATPEFWYFIK